MRKFNLLYSPDDAPAAGGDAPAAGGDAPAAQTESASVDAAVGQQQAVADEELKVVGPLTVVIKDGRFELYEQGQQRIAVIANDVTIVDQRTVPAPLNVVEDPQSIKAFRDPGENQLTADAE